MQFRNNSIPKISLPYPAFLFLVTTSNLGVEATRSPFPVSIVGVQAAQAADATYYYCDSGNNAGSAQGVEGLRCIGISPRDDIIYRCPPWECNGFISNRFRRFLAWSGEGILIIPFSAIYFFLRLEINFKSIYIFFYIASFRNFSNERKGGYIFSFSQNLLEPKCSSSCSNLKLGKKDQGESSRNTLDQLQNANSPISGSLFDRFNRLHTLSSRRAFAQTERRDKNPWFLSLSPSLSRERGALSPWR